MATGATRRFAILVVLVALATAGPAAAYWTPAPGTTWQWQLTGPIDQSVSAQVFEVDGFDTPASTVASLGTSGRRTVCYFSAGSYEDWRPDAASFPAEVLGADNGWPGERWLDIRRLDLLRPIMAGRMTMCRDKGFDAVEPDNVDGYANATGFPLTAGDQLAYNRMIAATAHGLGLSAALKNDVEQVVDLEPYFDFAVNEECFAFDECDGLSRFVAAGKAVFSAEYSGRSTTFCPMANALGFSTIKKRLALDTWLESCRPLTAVPPPPPPAPGVAPPVAPPVVAPPVPPSVGAKPVEKAHRTVRRTYACRGKAVRFTIAGKRYTVPCRRSTQVRRILVGGPTVIVNHLITIKTLPR
jgi:hypothetical protein